MMPKGIGSWKATELLGSVNISRIGVARSGRMCQLKAYSRNMNSAAILSYNSVAPSFSESGWENIRI